MGESATLKDFPMRNQLVSGCGQEQLDITGFLFHQLLKFGSSSSQNLRGKFLGGLLMVLSQICNAQCQQWFICFQPSQ
jgi:hypothetical protein